MAARVVVGGDDFRCAEGRGCQRRRQQVYAEKRPRELRMPIIRLVDGTGGGGSVRTQGNQGHTYIPANRLGHGDGDAQRGARHRLRDGQRGRAGAARVVTSHWSIMVRELAGLFVRAPVVSAGMQEEVTKEELGGWRSNTQRQWSLTCRGRRRRTRPAGAPVPSYLQATSGSKRKPEPNDDTGRREDSLLSAVPRNRRRPYKVREILKAVVDRDSWFEIGGRLGSIAGAGFGRLDGFPVGVVSNDPYSTGGMTADGSEKMAASSTSATPSTCRA